jgi:uncharacterized protein YjbI with pentapeptide repeats
MQHSKSSIPIIFKRTDFNERYAKGERNFRKTKLEGDFIGVNLSDTNLTKADLTDANLTEADLTNVNLTKTNLTNTVLTDATLTNVTIKGTTIGKAEFECLYAANIRDFSGVLFRGKNGDFTGVNFNETNLTNANFTDTNLTNANFTDTNLTATDFTNTNLTNVKGLNFKKAIEARAILEGATIMAPYEKTAGTLALGSGFSLIAGTIGIFLFSVLASALFILASLGFAAGSIYCFKHREQSKIHNKYVVAAEIQPHTKPTTMESIGSTLSTPAIYLLNKAGIIESPPEYALHNKPISAKS